jgi:hypothetical protein
MRLILSDPAETASRKIRGNRARDANIRASTRARVRRDALARDGTLPTPPNKKRTEDSRMAISFSKSIAQAASAGIMLGAMSSACGGSSTPPAASPAAADPATEQASAKECCKAKNDCKGKGGCKTDTNACAGQNECKGKGGCNGHCPK